MVVNKFFPKVRIILMTDVMVQSDNIIEVDIILVNPCNIQHISDSYNIITSHALSFSSRIRDKWNKYYKCESKQF